MPGSRTLHRHAALVSRMAETLGLDLTDALAHGVLTGEQWREAVLRCTGCDDPDACLSWMVARGGAQAIAAAPQPCRNAALFDDLRRDLVTGGMA